MKKKFRCPDCNQFMKRAISLIRDDPDFYCKVCEELWSYKFILKYYRDKKIAEERLK